MVVFINNSNKSLGNDAIIFLCFHFHRVNKFSRKMENLIIVTGYGRFSGHAVNASEEAVKLLPSELKVGSKTFQIRRILVSVEYDDVDRKVQEIWGMKPYLVVHCGEANVLNMIDLTEIKLYSSF